MVALPSLNHVESTPFKLTRQLLASRGLRHSLSDSNLWIGWVDLFPVIWRFDSYISCQDELVTLIAPSIMVCGCPNL